MKKMSDMNIKDTAAWLSRRDRFLVLTHRRPDGDTLGCAAGLVRALRETGKTAYVYFNPDITARYTPYVESYYAPEGYIPDYVIAVDIASLDLLPPGGEVYADAVDLCIDHHPSNTLYAANSCIDGEKAACGEIIYDLIMELCGKVSAEAAPPLYVALSTDTGCFAFSNTTANTLRVASYLAEAGAPIGKINKELFRKKARPRIVLESLIMGSMDFYFEGAVAIASITNSMMEKAGADEDTVDDIASLPGSIEGVAVGITIRELQNGSKVSVRTIPRVDANKLCARFGGGGHAMAAGCTINASVQDAKKMIVAAIEEEFAAQLI